MRNVSEKSYIENRNTHLMFKNCFSENGAMYKIIWKNVVQPDRTQITTWRKRFRCWITKATHTHSKCVILIALPRR